MTAISLGQAAHLTPFRRMTITGTIEVAQSSQDNSGYLLGLGKLREEFDDVRVGGVTSRPQEFSGGFVDFLLGRGGRLPR
jgi:hypothetical protein